MRNSWPKLFAASFFLAACGGDPKQTASSAAPPEQASTNSPSRPTGQPDARCPADGLWAVCSVEKRLKQSGFVAQSNDSAGARSGLSVKPVAYTLNKSRLELYIYPDEASLRRDVAKVDTTKIAPVFISSGNLAALLFTDDATQAERLSLALTAGAPQK